MTDISAAGGEAPTRRTACLTLVKTGLLALGRIVGPTAVQEVTKKVVDHGVKRAAAWVQTRSAAPVITDRLALIKTLFFATDDDIDIVPSTRRHLRDPTVTIDGITTYSTDAAAVNAIAGLFGAATLTIDDPQTVRTSRSFVCIGSNVANTLSAQVLGGVEIPIFSTDWPRRRILLKYALQNCPDEEKKILRYTNGEERRTTLHRLVSSGGQSVEPTIRLSHGNRLLDSDYLLVTHIPGRSQSSRITIFGGLHAPATRAVELLLNTAELERDLKYLFDQVDQGCFQAVFRVRGLAEVNGTTTASEIRLIKDDYFGPIKLS